MKVLHIWNTAGVASTLAQYMDQLFNTTSHVIMKGDYDKFGFTTYGEVIQYKHNTILHKIHFALKCLWRCRGKDIIHVHGLYKLLPIIRSIFGKRRIVYHSHGTDMRWRWKQQKKYWRHAAVLLYATRDMESEAMPPHAKYFPTIVDTQLFCNDGGTFTPNSAFSFAVNADNYANRMATQHHLVLSRINRDVAPVPYTDLPALLRRYEYYLDARLNPDGHPYYDDEAHISLSKTALEALACGCKVIQMDGSIVTDLPSEHHPDMAVSVLYHLYQLMDLN